MRFVVVGLIGVVAAAGCGSQPEGDAAIAADAPLPAAAEKVEVHSLGEFGGVRQIVDEDGEKWFVDANGSPAGSGVWQSEDGTFEMEFREGRKNGIERHTSINFTRVTPYVDGQKHGLEVIVDHDGAGRVIQWKTLEFEAGEAVGKTAFHFPEVDGSPPDVSAPFDELHALAETTNN